MNRTGNPQRMKRRNSVPRRTPSRPRPYKRAPARSLWRLALGLPARKGLRLKRPSVAQRRRARRTLRLRGLAHLWATRKIPGRLNRWHWDRIFAKVPSTIVPQYPQTVPEPKAKAQPGKRHTIPPEAPRMSTQPHEIISEAFAQLAQFTPDSASDMGRFLEHHHEMFADISRAYLTLADRMQSEMPYGQATPDSMRDLGAAFDGLSSVAQQVHATFRTEHAEKLARLEAPNPGEEQWDVRGQG